MIEKLKERFQHINVEDAYPYIQDVFSRLPDEEQKKLLENKKIEIITMKKDERGSQISFRIPVESLILFNWQELSGLRDLQIKYGIAHEIAHHFAGRGETGLWEKEADDLLRKWGFEKEIEAAGYSESYFEGKGYNIGYEGAEKELSPSDTQWFPILCMLINDWKNDKLIFEKENNLYSFIYTTSIGDSLNQEADNKTINDDNRRSLAKGVMYGIMYKVKELEGKKKLQNDIKSKFRG
jgi:hypothetical protein